MTLAMHEIEPETAARYLGGIDAFRHLPADTAIEIGRICRWHRFDKDAQIIRHLDESQEVFLVGEGKVRATIFSPSGREISYQDLGQGAMFGELSAIDGGPLTSHVITLQSSVIGTLSVADFWHAVTTHAVVAEAVLKRLAGLVRFLCNRVYEYGAFDVKDRVRVEVLRLARQSPQGDNRAVIARMPTHSEIANRISTHREAVTRELNELAKSGLIEKSGRAITIPDVARLAALLPSGIGLD